MAIGIYFSPAAMSAAKYDEVHQIIEKGWGGQPDWTFVPCGVWPERQTDGVRCLDIAGGVRQVREDADAHPSTTRDGSQPAERDAGAQGDRAEGEGRLAQEAGESLCAPAEALTTTGPSRPRGYRGRTSSAGSTRSRSGLSVPLLKRVRITPRIAHDSRRRIRLPVGRSLGKWCPARPSIHGQSALWTALTGDIGSYPGARSFGAYISINVGRNVGVGLCFGAFR
jgi:hypothetical protein